MWQHFLHLSRDSVVSSCGCSPRPMSCLHSSRWCKVRLQFPGHKGRDNTSTDPFRHDGGSILGNVWPCDHRGCWTQRPRFRTVHPMARGRYPYLALRTHCGVGVNFSQKQLHKTGGKIFLISIGFAGATFIAASLMLLGAKWWKQKSWKILVKT